jgi:Fe-S cluster assembly protein SufD
MFWPMAKSSGPAARNWQKYSKKKDMRRWPDDTRLDAKLTSMIKISEYDDILKKALPALPGGLFSDVRRTRAMEQLSSIGLPSRALEDWKYSDARALNAKCFRPASPATENEQPNAIIKGAISDWPQLVFVNGALVTGDVAGIKGIELLALGTAFDGPDWAHPILEVDADDAMANFNLAFAQGGYAMRITKDFNADGLELVMIYQGGTAEACHVRNFILLEDAAHLNLLSRTIFKGGIGWINQETIIEIGNAARLDHYVDLASPTKGFLSTGERVRLNAGEYHQHCLLSNAQAARHVISADILKAGSTAALNGAFLAGHGETLDTLTRLTHTAGDATSEQRFKGVTARGGNSAFQGRIVVEKDAQHTLANQTSNNLLLAPGAATNVKPELLIYADDVKCAHGATVGELDEQALFYLTQRGIEPDAAHAMLVAAFLGEFIEAVPDKTIGTYFASKIDGWMAQATNQVADKGSAE